MQADGCNVLLQLLEKIVFRYSPTCFTWCVSFEISILHLFPWSGIIDENQELSNTFRVPDLKTGRMSRLITQLSKKEEEMFRNMIRRLNTIVKVFS